MTAGSRGFSIVQRVAFWIVVVLLMVYSAAPFYWALNTSLKVDDTPSALPESPTLENYAVMLANSDFIRSIINSGIVAGAVTLISVGVGGLAAYALGRFNFYGRSAMRYVILIMNLFPTIAVLPSLFQLMSDLGLTGSITSLIVTYPIFALPTTTLALVAFFRTLPPDIEQAAYVDGATTFQLFVRVLLPLAMPVIVSVGLITFVGVWSEYLLAISFTSAPPDARTIAAAVKFLSGSVTPPELMAGAVILSVPLIVIIAYTQRHFLRNTTEGAVKG